jgi:hypothetical protein
MWIYFLVRAEPSMTVNPHTAWMSEGQCLLLKEFSR